MNRYPPNSQNGYQGNWTSDLYGIQTPLPLITEISDDELFELELARAIYGPDPFTDRIIEEQHMVKSLLKEIGEFPFLTPPDEDIYGPVNIGHCLETGAPVGIYPQDVHFCCIGRSGCGKSTLFRNLIRQHIQNETAVLIIDFENEYSEALDDDSINTFGLKTIKWNPLEVPAGMDPVLYRQMFASVFADVCGLLIASKSYLTHAVDQLYSLYGVYDGSETYPSMYDLADYLRAALRRLKSNSRTYTYTEVCLNRVEGFIDAMPDILDCSRGMPLDVLTQGNVIIELHGIDPEYQALFVCLMLTWICCHRISNGLRNNPQHDLAVFIDEAANLWSAHLERRPYMGVPTVSDLAARVRKYGLKFFLASQQSTNLASSIKANSYTKLAFSLGHGADIADMASAMFLDDAQTYFSRTLEVGHAICKFSGRYTEPFPIEIPYDE